MPYISQKRRNEIKQFVFSDAEVKTISAGDFNWCISTTIDDWLLCHGVSYDNINKMIGMLECVKLELHRRIAVPYEDKKKDLNGDVFSKENLTVSD